MAKKTSLFKCENTLFQWDDKITTLPGLYIVSVGILNPISQWTGQMFCDPVHLRAINVLMSALICLILQRINVQIHGDKHVSMFIQILGRHTLSVFFLLQYFDESKALLSSINLTVFPLLYFFNFLYYTDVGSTFMVLLMYCLHLDRRDWFAAFLGNNN